MSQGIYIGSIVYIHRKFVVNLNYNMYYTNLWFTHNVFLLIEAGGGTGPFSIDQSTAAIRLSSSLDYETKTSYVITVVATDGGGSQVETKNDAY